MHNRNIRQKINGALKVRFIHWQQKMLIFTRSFHTFLDFFPLFFIDFDIILKIFQNISFEFSRQIFIGNHLDYLKLFKKPLEYFELFSNFVVSLKSIDQVKLKKKIEDCSATPISGSEKVSNYIFRYCTSNRQTVRKRAFFNWNSGHETLALVS